VPGLDLSVLYWTSRGLGVLDVNYGGSTGYGRAYRDRLKGAWGVVDVADACTGAQHLADTGRVDGTRMAITGGSAGGYTTLAALTFRDTFAAGASCFGISDLSALAAETHKFESRYCSGLVGPWPEAEQVYRDRSPLHHVDRLSCPIILLQGDQDRVVPPNQAQLMADAVRAKGLPVAHLLFEGEGHGFRSLDSQVRAREAEAYFYGRVFGYQPADDIAPVPIDYVPG
jgi:dipeptidyl aminopeptidase/acylaminoacyl peptidase